MIKLILTLYQASVIAAADAIEGLKQIKRYRPDLIVSDIAL